MSRIGSIRSTQKIVLSLLIVCFLVLGLLVAVLLVRQQQDVRSDAMNTRSNNFEQVYPLGVREVISDQYIVLISGTLTANNIASARSIQVATSGATGGSINTTLYIDPADSVVLISQFPGGIVPTSYSQEGVDVTALQNMLRAGQRVAAHVKMGSSTEYQNILSPSMSTAFGTVMTLFVSN